MKKRIIVKLTVSVFILVVCLPVLVVSIPFVLLIQLYVLFRYAWTYTVKVGDLGPLVDLIDEVDDYLWRLLTRYS